MEREIEAVARALHSAEDETQSWDHETESVRQEFRRYAEVALALLAQQCGQEHDDKHAIAFPYAA